MLAELFRLLKRLWPIAALATSMGAASGIATAALLALTNRALRESANALPGLLMAFVALCVLTLAGEVISDIGNSLVGQRVIATLRRELCEKIIAAPIGQIERFRSHRLITALNQDIDTLSAFSFLFSSLAIACATIVGCLGYLFVLSPALLLIALGSIGLGTAVQAFARRVGLRRFGAAREAEDRLQKHYQAITEGAKELRLNAARRDFIYRNELSGTIDAIARLRVRAANVFVSANAFGSLLYFVVVGIMLALQMRAAASDRAVFIGFVLVLLYVKGPIQELVGALPSFGRAQIALQRIAALSAQFSTPEPSLTSADNAHDTPSHFEAFSSIELRNVRYRFAGSLHDHDADNSHDSSSSNGGFELGPLSLSIARGETLFIVGENGSGKTTLIKLLLGLYRPDAGTLCVDGVPVDDAQRDAYRQIFSAVFSDYHLFDTLSPGDDALGTQALAYLDRLQIAHKVTVKNGAFTTTDLSTGQRKRLALVHTWLEGRPVIVLDEWAADQDPTFRRIFYTEILPDLKRQGKTLIVISHDDRYFGMADRIVRIEDGKLVV